MRMNLPPEYRRAVTDAIGDIDFDYFHNWFDFIFVASATITICYHSGVHMYRKMYLADDPIRSEIV
jgi:hypothetical protein